MKLYFIVQEDDLGKYGSMVGSTKEEAEGFMKDLGPGDNIVVVCGEIIKPVFMLPESEK